MRQRLKDHGFRPRVIGELIQETRPAAVANDPENFLEELTTALEAQDDVDPEMPLQLWSKTKLLSSLHFFQVMSCLKNMCFSSRGFSVLQRVTSSFRVIRALKARCGRDRGRMGRGGSLE